MGNEAEEFDYNSVFDEIEGKKKEQIDPKTKKIPVYHNTIPDKIIGWKDPVTGVVEFETKIKERGKFNKAYDFRERKRMEFEEKVQQRITAQKARTEYIKLGNRDNIEKEIIELSPETSISTIISDGGVLAQAKENFEVLEVSMNGFSVVDLLDGRFEEFEEFIKENRLKMYNAPMASYYLNSAIVQGNNAVPAGKNKYCVFSTEKIPVADQTVFDNVMLRDIVEVDEKNKHDLLIAACSFMGYDEDVTYSILEVMDGNAEEVFHKLYDFLLQEKFDEYFEKDDKLRREVMRKKSLIKNASFARILEALPEAEKIKNKIILDLCPNKETTKRIEELLSDKFDEDADEELATEERAYSVNEYDENMQKAIIRGYIKMQTDELHKPKNYARIKEFWDSLEQIVRSTCKTGSVKTAIKAFDDSVIFLPTPNFFRA